MTYEQARQDLLIFLAGGSPAKSAAAWLSAIDKAEREGKPCPDWAELERIAPSLSSREEPPPGPQYTEDDPDWAAMVSPISEDGGHDER